MKANTYACIGFVFIAVGSLFQKIPPLTQRVFDYTISDFTEGFLDGVSIVTLITGVALLGFYLGRRIEQKIRK